jgi:hypothetical protein
MIRQPTSLMKVLAWWREAIRSPEAIPRHPSDPEAGFYRVKLAKGGAWVPVNIYLYQAIDDETGELAEPEKLICELGWDGERVNPLRLWTHVEPISRAEFVRLMAVKRDGTKKINLMKRATLPNG